MNRRTLVSALLATPLLALGSLPAPARPTPHAWRLIGRHKIRANDKALSIALGDLHKDVLQFELRATQQSLWVDSVTVHGPRDQTWTKAVALNLPPGGKLAFGKHLPNARKLTVQVYYLPFDNEPTHVELWGTADPPVTAPRAA